MACQIAAGRLEPCKDVVGGLQAVYLSNFDAFSFDQITFGGTDGEVSAIAGTPETFKYELRGTSDFNETITSSRENGTTFYEQVLTLNLKKLTPKSHKEIKFIATNRPKVFVEDNNGNIFLAGAEFGMDLTAGNITRGAAMGDSSGYTLTLTGMERQPAEFLDDTLTNVGVTTSSTYISDI
jgi:hypothetical protein